MMSAEFEKAAEQVALYRVNTDVPGKQLHQTTF
jgi:hypothetical protein